MSTYVRRTDSPELDLENNTHYSLSLRMSRAAVPYYISPALHKKKLNLGGYYATVSQLGMLQVIPCEIKVGSSQCCTKGPKDNL